MVVAVRGHGAWTAPLAVSGDFTQLRVSSRTDPAAARLLRSVESAHTDVDLTEAWVRTLGIQVPPVEMDSQAKYAVLAAGGADLILRLPPPESPEYRENLWDQAAGSLVLEEAGGRTTDIEEKPLDFTTGRRLIRNRGVLASNGHLHDVAHKALARIRGS